MTSAVMQVKEIPLLPVVDGWKNLCVETDFR